MVLNILSLLFFLFLSGCATMGGYERYGIYSERNDRIYDHRASFLEDGRISMAYAIVYWDVLPPMVAKEGMIPEVYYIWLRNNIETPIKVDPDYLSLVTEKGEVIHPSKLTNETPAPFIAGELDQYEVTGGYIVFEISREVFESDRPSRLVYDDLAGNRAIRYLQIEDMKRYEGLILERGYYYYAPVYPRRYWYLYYYPYAYYPFDIHFYYFYTYTPHRRYYYYIPVEPKRREFYVPPSPLEKREFRGSSGLQGGDSTEDRDKGRKSRKERREF